MKNPCQSTRDVPKLSYLKAEHVQQWFSSDWVDKLVLFIHYTVLIRCSALRTAENNPSNETGTAIVSNVPRVKRR